MPLGVNYVYTNLLGNEAGRAVYDGDAMIASCGKMLAIGSRFSFTDVQVTTAIVDLDVSRMWRTRLASFRPDVGSRRVVQAKTTTFRLPSFPTSPPLSNRTGKPAPTASKKSFTQAVTLGLFDYLRKSRSRGFVVFAEWRR